MPHYRRPLEGRSLKTHPSPPYTRENAELRLLYIKSVQDSESLFMNFDQAKALRLRQWRSTLANHDFRMQNPKAYRQTLHAMSATLTAEGLIDELQRFDLNEMANAACWHAVEELQTCAAHNCSAST